MPHFSRRPRSIKVTTFLILSLFALLTSAFIAEQSRADRGDDIEQRGEPLPTPIPGLEPPHDHSEHDHNLEDDYLSSLTENEPRFNATMAGDVVLVESNVGGQWGPVITWPHTPVSMANLPDGRILTWSGSEREFWPTTEQTYSAVWDPKTGTFDEYFFEGHNMFCADLVMLEDGRILALGGRNTTDLVSIFDFSTSSWTAAESMNTRRWYPTSIVLGNGDVFTAVGKGGRYPERYTVGEGWTLLTGADLQGPILDYGANKDGAGWWPLMHLDPRGNIFHYGATPEMYSINPAGNGTISPLGPNNFSWFPEEAVAIMYDEGKILVAGGALNSGTDVSSNQAATIDINSPTPVITNIAPMNIARQFANEVMLPNGQVLVIGGNTTGAKFSDSGTVLDAEIWDPDTQSWTLLNPMTVPRNYHSTAILLPDGRVLSAGGGYAAGNPDHPATHTDGQVFSPPYLFNPDGTLAARPQITAAPDKISSGDNFAVQASSDVVAFSLVRMSATTHTMNPEQMFIDVPFSGSGGSFSLTAHSNPNVLVPGYWMLFALNDSGVPSEAHLIQVNASGKPWVLKLNNQSSVSGLATTVQVEAGDTDGDTLTFAAANLPNGISIDPATGTMSGTPTVEGTFTVNLTVSDDQGNSRATSFVWTIFPQGQGQITREWWFGIGGVTIAELTSNAAYPDNPTGSEIVSSFEGPVNWADNYGSRIHGYLTAPVTGSYTFWIASDDNGELWLSSSEDPAGVARIAHVPGWSNSREWTKYPEQQSAAINLVGGQTYYISALMNEGGGGDNLAVAWQIPGQTGPTVIDGAYLSTYNKPVSGNYRYVRLVASSEVNGNPWTSAAEINVLDVNGTVIDRSGWTATSDSEEPDGVAGNALDGNSGTLWHTEWRAWAGDANDPPHPHEIVIDMGAGYDIGGLRYLPRQDATLNGTIQNYEIFVSEDGSSWISVASGSWAATQSEKEVTFAVNPAQPLVLSPLTAGAVETGAATSYTAVSSGGTGTVRYKWQFGDGTPETAYSSSPSTNHTFAQPGRYLVTLTATDDADDVQVERFVQIVYNTPTANRPAHSASLVYESRSGNDRLWSVNPDNDTVSVVDAVTLAKVGEIGVGQGPESLAIAPTGRIWVVNAESSSISIIDQATLTVLNTINLARGAQPYGLVFSPTGNAGYVALEQTGQLLALDPNTGSTTGAVAVGLNARHVSVTADGATVYVTRFITPPLPGEETAVVQTSGVGGEVVVIDATSLTASGTLILQVDNGSDFEAGARGVPNYLSAMVIAPDGLSAWVPSKEDNILRGQLRDGLDLNFEHTVRAISSYINLTTGQEEYVFRLDHDNSSVGSGGAFSTTGNYLFVALETSREVAVVDAYSKLELFRIDVGRAPQSVVVSPDGMTLYVHNFMDRSVGVYDLSTLIETGAYVVNGIATVDLVANETLTAQELAGKQLFYDAADPRLALDGYMSCASCHSDGGGDGRTWDFTGFGEGLRNTISLEGHGGPTQGPLHWTANFNEVHDFEGQIRAFAGGTGLMSDADFNSTSDPLGSDKAGLSADLDALAAYVNMLTTFGSSPYRSTDGSLTADGAAGQAIFQASGCATCHGGQGFTDSPSLQLHDVGTLTAASGSRIGGPLTGLDTPTLRGLWATGPYLHDGSAGTLADAVNAHSGISISGSELTQLVSYLNQIDDSEPAPAAPPPPPPPPPPPAAGPQLAYGTVTNVGDGWQTVTLAETYSNMVVIATVQMDINALPAVTRVRNAAGSSFEVRVQNPSGTPLSGYNVHYLVAEAGVYTQAADGITMEAVLYNSAVTDEDASWVGENRAYQQPYASPVVVGQVMTFNDPAWSVFWARGSSRTDPPDSSNLWVGKNVGEDPAVTRAAETVGYIVFEAGSGVVGDIAFEAAVGSDTVVGIDQNSTYDHTLGVTPAAIVLSAAAIDGSNGGWPALYGLDGISVSDFTLAFDEDQVWDSERGHTTEQVAFVALVDTNAPPPPPPPPPAAGPQLASGIVTNVGSSWQTVTLPQAYSQAVVIGTPQYSESQLPAVVRIRNVTDSSFELRVQNPSDAPLSGYTVQYVVAEAGVYSAATHGITMEVMRVDSTVTDRKGSWVGSPLTPAQGYTNPVVLGQVLTANDVDWSVFWARGSSQGAIPSGSDIYIGKHVGEDTDTTRGTETLGVIIVESGSYVADGVAIEVGVGSDIVRGITNAPPFSYAIGQSGQAAVLSASAMDGGDGGWPLLYGSAPLGGSQIALAFDEDQVSNTERSHTTEQVAYLVIR